MRSNNFFLKLAALAALTANIVSADIFDDDSTFTDEDIASISSAKSMTFGNTVGSICGCTLLSIFAFGKVHFPGSSKFDDESKTKFWSASTWDTPRCVFVPTSAKDVAKGVTVMDLCKAEFAIRGGGHMPIPEFSNTHNGILFALSGLNTLSLSSNRQSVSVGPGNNWGKVYKYLENYGLYAIGGRLSSVGVPGLILGGGVNFFSNKYGFAADNVIAYEVVLASGQIVTATATNVYSDLYWALKGGGSNFGIVTRFDLKTYAIPKVWSGMGTFVAEESFDQFYSALVNFTNSGYTAKGAGIIPQINFQPSPAGDLKVGVHVLVHEGDTVKPEIFKEFNQVGTTQYQSSVDKPAAVSEFLSTGILGKRHAFHVQSSLATLEAVKWTHAMFYQLAEDLKTKVSSLQSAGIAFQPIPASIIDAGKITGGNTFGIKTKSNYIWYAVSVNWDNAADDAKVEEWLAELGEAMTIGYENLGVIGNDGRQFLYMNDAQGCQDIFASYGPAELTKLKTIRQKYDKNGKMFGKDGLCKGGFKLPF